MTQIHYKFDRNTGKFLIILTEIWFCFNESDRNTVLF